GHQLYWWLERVLKAPLIHSFFVIVSVAKQSQIFENSMGYEIASSQTAALTATLRSQLKAPRNDKFPINQRLLKRERYSPHETHQIRVDCFQSQARFGINGH